MKRLNKILKNGASLIYRRKVIRWSQISVMKKATRFTFYGAEWP